MKPVQEETIDGLTIKIHQDQDPTSPRENDNLGTMACFHKRYSLGDEDHGFSGPEDLQTKLKEKGCVFLPIYMMDHSGLTLSTNKGTFQACDPQGWDWGQLGFIFADAEKIRKEYNVKRISPSIREKVLSCLQSEVNEYNQYIQGDIYGFVIENESGEHLDSCWGYYGIEYCLEEARNHAKDIAGNLVGSGAHI